MFFPQLDGDDQTKPNWKEDKWDLGSIYMLYNCKEPPPALAVKELTQSEG